MDAGPSPPCYCRWTPRVAATALLAAAGVWLVADRALQAPLLPLWLRSRGRWSDVREQVEAATTGRADERDKNADASTASGWPGMAAVCRRLVPWIGARE
jgi:hypothetical protein